LHTLPDLGLGLAGVVVNAAPEAGRRHLGQGRQGECSKEKRGKDIFQVVAFFKVI
jgi:hypothetical protein